MPPPSDPFDLSQATPEPAPDQGGGNAAAGGAGNSVSAQALGHLSERFLSQLNPEQRQAAEKLDGAVLVLAGAGTGKTRVLVSRLAHILATRRAFPSQILAVTFTNKAAREMRERVAALLQRPVEGWWLGTFHAIAARILRAHAERLGLRPE